MSKSILQLQNQFALHKSGTKHSLSFGVFLFYVFIFCYENYFFL